MPTILTAELVERAKAAADMHDNFVTLRQWLTWASLERMALDLLIARAGWTQAFATTTITVDGSEDGEFTPDTTSGIMAIVAIHQVSPQGTRLLRTADPATFLRTLPGGEQRGNATHFRARQDEDTLILNFFPEPAAGETYLVTYIPHPRRLTTADEVGYDTSVSYPMGWEERIVLGMARRALEKEESDSTGIRLQITEMERQIEELIQSRAGATSIINMDQVNYGWCDRVSYPPILDWWWA